MPAFHNTLVTIQSRNNRSLPETSGEISEVSYDKTDRLRNALKTFGLWIAMTFMGIFVPILHFVLVPTLLITSFVLAIEKSREEKRNQGGSGECPKCHQKFEIQKSKWMDRLVDVCDTCHDDLEIHVVLH